MSATPWERGREEALKHLPSHGHALGVLCGGLRRLGKQPAGQRVWRAVAVFQQELACENMPLCRGVLGLPIAGPRYANVGGARHGGRGVAGDA